MVSGGFRSGSCGLERVHGEADADAGYEEAWVWNEALQEVVDLRS